jgi:SAM-dependent methyltransferase
MPQTAALTDPTYAALTRDDPNPIKRAVQVRRLADALRLAADLNPRRIVDFGGGDGALCRQAATVWPGAELVCFEPAPQLAAEARLLLAETPQVRVAAEESALPSGGADLVFCTEVFEHLPPAETVRALDEIVRILAPGGRAVIGVPVEVGPPALAKGAFRAARRPGAFDARAGAIASALVGRAPAKRPLVEISPGRAYYPHHLGFDHRRLADAILARFRLERRAGSPFLAAPAWLNSEIYFRVRRD